MEKQNTDLYKKMQVETADPLSLILMLYDRAIVLIEKANNEIAEKKYEEKGISLEKATNIVFELIAVLDTDKGGEIAFSLTRLYNFVIRELLEANIKLNTKALGNAKRILKELRESWIAIKNHPDTAVNIPDNITASVDLSG